MIHLLPVWVILKILSTCWKRADAWHGRNESFALFTSFEYKHLPATNWPPAIENVCIGFLHIQKERLSSFYWADYGRLGFLILTIASAASMVVINLHFYIYILFFHLFFLSSYSSYYSCKRVHFPFPPFFCWALVAWSASLSMLKLYLQLTKSMPSNTKWNSHGKPKDYKFSGFFPRAKLRLKMTP